MGVNSACSYRPNLLPHPCVQFRPHDLAFLRGGLLSRANEHGRRRAAIHGDVRHRGGNEPIVTGADDLAVFEPIASEHFDFLATQRAISGFPGLMDLRPRAPPGGIVTLPRKTPVEPTVSEQIPAGNATSFWFVKFSNPRTTLPTFNCVAVVMVSLLGRLTDSISFWRQR